MIHGRNFTAVGCYGRFYGCSEFDGRCFLSRRIAQWRHLRALQVQCIMSGCLLIKRCYRTDLTADTLGLIASAFQEFREAHRRIVDVNMSCISFVVSKLLAENASTLNFVVNKKGIINEQ